MDQARTSENRKHDCISKETHPCFEVIIFPKCQQREIITSNSMVQVRMLKMKDKQDMNEFHNY